MSKSVNMVPGHFEQFMTMEETAEFIGFSTTKLWKWRKKKAFPEPLKTPSGQVLGYTKSQLVAWQQSLY